MNLRPFTPKKMDFNGAMQQIAMLQNLLSHFRQEQKLVTHLIKSLVLNSFCASEVTIKVA